MWWCLVCIFTWVEAVPWEAFTSGFFELEFFAILALEGVCQRVEVESAGDGQGDDQVWRSNESVGGWVGIVPASEVTVV